MNQNLLHCGGYLCVFPFILLFFKSHSVRTVVWCPKWDAVSHVLMYRRESRGPDPRLLDTESKVVLFVKSVSNVKSFNHVFVFAQMKMDGRCEPGKRKVLQVNSGFYFAQFVQLLFSNIIREISCEVIYSLIY